MSESRFLKTVLFGGYERTGVEKRFEYLTSQLFSIKNELRENKLLLAELRKGTDVDTAAENVLAGERAKLTQVQVQYETVSKIIKTVEEDLRTRDQEVEELKAQVESLKEQLAEKDQKLIGYESGSDAVALSAVFIEAQKSADLLVQTKKKEAADLDANSRKLADNIIAEANNTARKIVYDAEVQSAETLAEAESKSAKMETASNNLRATVLTDVEQLSQQIASIQQLLEAFQNQGIPSLNDSAKLLTDVETKLKSGGVPVFRVPETVLPVFPEEPEYEEVDYEYNGSSDEDAEKKAEKDKQNSEALAKLRQMADALSSVKKEKSESREEKAKPGNAPDLAALAAQAAALKNNHSKK